MNEQKISNSRAITAARAGGTRDRKGQDDQIYTDRDRGQHIVRRATTTKQGPVQETYITLQSLASLYDDE